MNVKELEKFFKERNYFNMQEREQTFKFLEFFFNYNTGNMYEISCFGEGKTLFTDYLSAENWKDKIDKILSYNKQGNIYFCFNPTKKEVAEKNKISGDKDILKREWIYIDIDSINGKPATKKEIEECRSFAFELIELLYLPYDQFILNYSGNGISLLISTDIQENILVKEYLKQIKNYAENAGAKCEIDCNVFNLKKAIRLPGTYTTKGNENIEEGRTFRPSKLIWIPKQIRIRDLNHFKNDVAYFEYLDEMENISTQGTEEEYKSRIQEIKNRYNDKSKALGFDKIPKDNLTECREFPSYEDLYGKHTLGCSLCGNKQRLCHEGITQEGHEWGLCWSTEEWETIGQEGQDYVIFKTLGDAGSAFYWKDGHKIGGRKDALNWLDKYREFLDSFAKQGAGQKEQDEPKPLKTVSLASLPDGLFKDLAYTVQRESLCCDAYGFEAAQAIIAALAANRIRLSVGYKNYSLAPYVIYIGKAHNARKSSTCETIRSFVHSVNTEISYLTNYTSESIGVHLNKRIQKTAILYEDEFKSILDAVQYKKDLTTFLTISYNGTYNKITRAKDKSEIELRDYCIISLGATTPQWLFDSMQGDYSKISSGFLARYSLCVVPENDPILEINPDRTKDVEDFLASKPKIDRQKVFDCLKSFDNALKDKRIFCLMANEAGNVLADYSDFCHSQIKKQGYYGNALDLIEAIVNRNNEKIKRTAAAFRLSRLNPDEINDSENTINIEKEDIEVSIKYHETQLHLLISLLNKNDFGESEDAVNAKKIMEGLFKLNKSGKVKQKEIKGIVFPVVSGRDIYKPIFGKKTQGFDSAIKLLIANENLAETEHGYAVLRWDFGESFKLDSCHLFSDSFLLPEKWENHFTFTQEAKEPEEVKALEAPQVQKETLDDLFANPQPKPNKEDEEKDWEWLGMGLRLKDKMPNKEEANGKEPEWFEEDCDPAKPKTNDLDDFLGMLQTETPIKETQENSLASLPYALPEIKEKKYMRDREALERLEEMNRGADMILGKGELIPDLD